MRQMPALQLNFTRAVAKALDIAKAGEIVRATAPPRSLPWKQFYPARIEALYELAFLSVFGQWELFLESSFVRYMCGMQSSTHGAATMKVGGYSATIRMAELAMHGGKPYLLWHNPVAVIARSQKFFTGGRHELVVGSNQARIDSFAAARHRIAHASSDARTKFDAATTSLVGRRYGGGRPGRFLRDWVPLSTPRKRWLDSICHELIGLAGQIV